MFDLKDRCHTGETASNHHGPPEGKPLATRLGLSPGWWAMVRLVASLRRWRQAAVGRRLLARLTDRELRDIGLTRGDVYRAVVGVKHDGRQDT